MFPRCEAGDYHHRRLHRHYHPTLSSVSQTEVISFHTELRWHPTYDAVITYIILDITGSHLKPTLNPKRNASASSTHSPEDAGRPLTDVTTWSTEQPSSNSENVGPG